MLRCVTSRETRGTASGHAGSYDPRRGGERDAAVAAVAVELVVREEHDAQAFAHGLAICLGRMGDGAGGGTDALEIHERFLNRPDPLARRPRPRARVDDEGESVAESVAHDVAARNIGAPGSLGPIGLVVGATVDRRAYGLSDIVLAGTPILAPGFGAQGAEPGDLQRLFGYVASQVVASESRSILAAGPEAIPATIEAQAARYREVLGG